MLCESKYPSVCNESQPKKLRQVFRKEYDKRPAFLVRNLAKQIVVFSVRTTTSRDKKDPPSVWKKETVYAQLYDYE